MQAIQTKFLGPTNTRGSRVKATCWLKSVTIAWDHALNVEDNHKAAIDALVMSLNYDRKDNSSMAWNVTAIGESVDGKGKTAIIDLAPAENAKFKLHKNY